MIQIHRSSGDGAGGVGRGGASQDGARAAVGLLSPTPIEIAARLDALQGVWPMLVRDDLQNLEHLKWVSVASDGIGYIVVADQKPGPDSLPLKGGTGLSVDFFAVQPAAAHTPPEAGKLFTFKHGSREYTAAAGRNMLPIDNLHRYDDPLAALLGQGEQSGGRFEVTFKWEDESAQSVICQSLPEGTRTNKEGEVGLTVVNGLDRKGREQVREQTWWLKPNVITTVNRAGRLEKICGPASNSSDLQQDPFGLRSVKIREDEIDRLPHHLARFQHVEVTHRNLSNQHPFFVTCKMVFLSSGPLNQHDGTKTSQDYVLGLIKAENNWEVAVIPWEHVVTITPQSTDHNGTQYFQPDNNGYIRVGSPTFEKS